MEHHIPKNNDVDNLTSLISCLASSFGPAGRVKIYQACPGGSSIVTSASEKLVDILTSKCPAVNMVLSSMRSHIQQNKDGGLFVGILSASLALQCNTANVNHVIADEILTRIHSNIISHVQLFDDKLKLDISQLSLMIKFISDVICTKPTIGLCKQSLNHLAFILIQLISKEDHHSSSIEILTTSHILYQHGIDTLKSKIVEGLLLEFVGNEDCFNQWKDIHTQPYRVAVTSSSLAGDFLDRTNAALIVADSQDCIAATSYNFIMNFIENLCEFNIDILFCQKVIHPYYQAILESKGILVFSRVGLKMINTIAHASGATIIQHIGLSTRKDLLGDIQDLNLISFCSKRYISINTTEKYPHMNTAVIYSSTEYMLDELKVVCESAMYTIRNVFNSPHTLPGGGCFETAISAIIKRMKKPDNLNCTEVEFRYVALAFAKSFETVAMAIGGSEIDHYIDENSAHHWLLPRGCSPEIADIKSCCCGMFHFSKEIKLNPFLELQHESVLSICESKCAEIKDLDLPTVQDSRTIRLNGISTALNCAMSIIRIGGLDTLITLNRIKHNIVLDYSSK